MKEKIENAIGLVYTVVEALCRLVLIFMVCTVTAQVISRALGGNIKWCEEVMLILLDTMMFLLLPVGIKDDLHIRIEVFAKYFPRKVKVFLLYFSNAILLVVSLCMIRYGFFLMEKTNSKLRLQVFQEDICIWSPLSVEFCAWSWLLQSSLVCSIRNPQTISWNPKASLKINNGKVMIEKRD